MVSSTSKGSTRLGPEAMKKWKERIAALEEREQKEKASRIKKGKKITDSQD